MAGIGGTVANVLSVCELLDNELETASGEPDEARAITALVQAQHYFETLAATYPDVLQDTTTVTTTAATEATTWATTLLRLDALWYLDSNSNPIRQLKRISEIGGHVPSLPWPMQVTLSAIGSGAPYGYYGNMSDFFWLPKPDATHTLRIYGLVEKDRFTVRTNDFNYHYRLHLPFAQFAVKLLSIGVADDTMELDKLAGQLFTPVLRQLNNSDRSEPHSRHYTEFHTT